MTVGVWSAVAVLICGALVWLRCRAPPRFWFLGLTERLEQRTRGEFAADKGRSPASSCELLAWLDERVAELPELKHRENLGLIKKYGATLGQLLVHDFGGTWVRDTSDRGITHGVLLPNDKIAFVFNRAARRIIDREPIGFLAFYEAAASMVKGKPMPAGLSTAVVAGAAINRIVELKR